MIASDTPSTGVRAINWISPSGVRWSYYLVKHTPVALAADPIAGDILMADESAGGVLRLVDASDPAHGTTPLDNMTGFGLSEAARDGDESAGQGAPPTRRRLDVESNGAELGQVEPLLDGVLGEPEPEAPSSYQQTDDHQGP